MPTVQPIVVLDPGHGGSTAVGASSPDRSTGILSEKALTLDLARRVRALLAPSATVMLTRDSDANLSLAARAGFARLVNADLFVSLHFNAAPDPGLDSTEVYVGRSSTDGDRRLAQALYHEVSSALGTVGGVLAADLGVVARSRHLDRTSVALLEVCDVSNPRRGAELRDPATLDRVARAVAAALGARLAAAAGPPVVATAARGLGVDEDAATVLAGIKARAAAQALEPRGFTGTERFVRVLRDRYLPEYLAAPGPATATTAITRISAQNTSNVVTEVCGEPDYWEANSRWFNRMSVPALSAVPGLGGLLDDIGAATEILTVASRRELDHIDGPFLLGRHGIDRLDCAAVQRAGNDPDLQADADLNESQLMHWATGVKYNDLSHDRARDLYLAYEEWHLELWDVFGRDPINDMIAEDAGWMLAQALRSGRVTPVTLLADLDDCFTRARRWVGGLLLAREADLDAQMLAQRPPDAHIHWTGQTITADSRDHPYPVPSVRAMLARGQSVDDVMATRLVQNYADAYTLIAEARANPEPLSVLQRLMAAGDLDWAFRAAGEPTSPRSRPVTTSSLRRPAAVAQADPAAGALTDAEWAQVLAWQAAGAVGADALTGDGTANGLLVACALFCARMAVAPSPGGAPGLCADRSVTEADPRVGQLAGQVASRGAIVNWAATTREQRQRYAVGRLVATYSYPVNAAAGLVGNLTSESEVMPPRLEASSASTPLDAPDFAGTLRHWSPQQVMDRSYAKKTGPQHPGVGLAQWTLASRRSGLFAHAYADRPAGTRILFDMDAQVDYLVSELRGSYAGVEAVLTDPAVTLEAASDEVVYSFETPGSMLTADGAKRERTDAAVLTVFEQRRSHSRAALAAYNARQ